MLTARDAVSERVEALDAGADDYLTKPFEPELLMAKLRRNFPANSFLPVARQRDSIVRSSSNLSTG